jgi:hypothetical protein
MMGIEGQAADPGVSSGNLSRASGKESGEAGTTLVTDLASSQPGSGPDPASQEGAQGGQTQGEGQQGAQATSLPKWSSAVGQEVRDDPRFSAWAGKHESFTAAVKSALELDSKIGGMVSYPSEKSSPEEIAAFWTKAGPDAGRVQARPDPWTTLRRHPRERA